MCVEKWVKRSGEACEFPAPVYEYHITRCSEWNWSTAGDRCNFRIYEDVVECEVSHMPKQTSHRMWLSDGTVWQDGDVGKDDNGLFFIVTEVIQGGSGATTLAFFRFGTSGAEYALPPTPLIRMGRQGKLPFDQIPSSAHPGDMIQVPDGETVDSVAAALRLVRKLGLLEIPPTGWQIVPLNVGLRLLP